MESASSQSQRLLTPSLDSGRPSQRWLAVFLIAAILFALHLLLPKLQIGLFLPLAVFLICTVWTAHIKSHSYPASLRYLLAMLFGFQLLASAWNRFHEFSGDFLPYLGGCVLLYSLLRSISQRYANPSLREISSVALFVLLSLFARPPVTYFVLSLGLVFWARCRANYGGPLYSAILVFSPTIMGIIIMESTKWLIPGYFLPGDLFERILRPLSWEYGRYTSISIQQVVPLLVLLGGIIICRLLESQAGLVDVFSAGVLLLLVVAIRADAVPLGLSLLDISTMSYAICMWLLTLALPNRVSTFALLVGSMSFSLVASLPL